MNLYSKMLKQLEKDGIAVIKVEDVQEEKYLDFVADYATGVYFLKIKKFGDTYVHNLFDRVYTEDELLDFIEYLDDTRNISLC